MRCPNCNYTLSEEKVCPKCGVNKALFSKTRSASNRCYNKGLLQAQNNDLSGAIHTMQLSVMFDKTNHKARNLLGLLYYQCGYIADALKQWIVSAAYNKTDSQAQQYIDDLQKNARLLERYDDSIQMYNQALAYLKQDSEDLALIQLKKALDNNSRFLEARNLLALCYISKQEITEARKLLERTLTIDGGNIAALRYLQECHPAELKKSLQAQKAEGTEEHRLNSDAAIFRPPIKSRTVIGKTEILAFAVGIICTAAVLLTLLIPAWVDHKTETIRQLESELADTKEELKQNEAMKSEYESVKTAYEQLKTETDQAKMDQALQQKQAILTQADSALSEGNAAQAAELLEGLDIAGISDEDALRYSTLKSAAYEAAGSDWYKKGKSSFQAKKYDQALNELENCIKYGAQDADYMDDVYYYLGAIHQNKGDVEKAQGYFQRVIDGYPSSNQLNNVKKALAELNG